MHNPPPLLAPVSTGELIDKITILEIKCRKLQRPEALENVEKELQALKRVLTEAGITIPHASERKIEPTNQIFNLTSKLELVNSKLWDVEDQLRLLEKSQDFGEKFIELARSVYRLNDERASCKREINQLCNSNLMEEKSYGEHQ